MSTEEKTDSSPPPSEPTPAQTEPDAERGAETEPAPSVGLNPPAEPGAVTEMGATEAAEPGAVTEMGATEPAELGAVTELGATEPVKTESKPDEEKGKKEKKPRAPRKKRTAPTHPPYFDMIKEAITALDVKTGSSPYAIAKFIGEKHKDELPSNYKKVLAVQLKNFTAKGKLVKIRASFKLPSSEEKKKPLETDIKTPTKARSKRKKPAPKEINNNNKKKSSSRPPRAKKAKKTAAPKPKQPKTIKSGGTKKANKAVAT